MDDRHEQAAIGLRGESQVDLVEKLDRVAVDTGVQLGAASQAEYCEASQQGDEAHRLFGPGGIEAVASLEQGARVRVHPDSGLGNLTARPGEPLRGDPTRAGERNPAPNRGTRRSDRWSRRLG